ncbi:MAG: Ig-like domain-containing protein [Candidatus Odinarchaeota archaeon]
MRKLVSILVPFLIVLFLIGSSNQPLSTNSQKVTPAIENAIEPVQNDSSLTTSDNDINPLAKKETVFYGMADDPSVRNIVGYADYILCSHALWSSGATIRDNVRYLSDHGVKVILVSGWWDVFPFTGAGINGWEDMHWENVVYGMNATESVKYRIRQMMDEIGPEYVWGISIGEEEPVGDQSFPWAFITWYMNLFYDWIHEEYPGVNVLQWIQPVPFYLQQAHNLKADAIIYDNYNQNYTEIAGIASQLKTAYPTTPLLFMISSVEHTDPWFTCHPPTYTKRAVAAIAPYADIIGFWLTDDYGNEGWEIEHEGYKLAQRICNQIHIMDANTIYGNTEWFECGFGNDTVTDSLDNWYGSYWRDQPPDTDLLIETSTDNKVGDNSINLTCTDFGTHSFWWQYLGHDYGFPDWPGIPNSHPINMTDASRITFWVKGFGWENHPSAKARIYIEESNYPLGYPGNLTLPEITSYLADGQWHRVTIDLPLPPSSCYDWEGYCSQLRIEVDYSESVVSNTVSILFDGWVVESFDTGKAHGLSSINDYVAVINGTLYIGGNAYFESHFPQANAWYYQYSGTGDIEMLLNGTWTSPPDEGIPCRWNVSAIRLSNGSFEWFKVNAIPPIVDILYPLENSLLSGYIEVQVNATDESGIDRVEFSVDDVLLHVDSTYPYTFTWDTTTLLDGVHLLNVTAWSDDLKSNFHDIEVTIDNTQPSLTINTPEEAEEVTGSVSISALTNDLSGIASVEFFLDGLSLFTDYTSPYEYIWNTLSASDGVHNITCQAVDIARNVQFESCLVTVDNSGPLLSMHSVSVWGSSGCVAVNTSDPSGIKRVEFFLDDTLQFTDYAYPYEWLWSGMTIPDGNHIVLVHSYDTLNHSSTASSGLQIDNTLPTLSVSWTPSETILSSVVEFNAIANDINGIAYVEFYLHGALQYTDYLAPYGWTWDTRLVADGNHSLMVIATDSRGNSKYVFMNLVVDNTGPSVTVNSPTNGTVLPGPCSMTVTISVYDATGIDTVLLSYHDGTSWNIVSMVPSGSFFQATTSTFPHNTLLTFYVFANDTLGNEHTSGLYQCTILDMFGPVIGLPTLLPEVPTSFNVVTVSTSVSDDSDVDAVLLSYRVDFGSWINVTMILNSVYWANIPAMPTGSLVSYRIFASDSLGQWNSSPIYEYTVVSFDVLPPTILGSNWAPVTPDDSQSVTVSVNATDPSGVSFMILAYHDGSSWHNITMVLLSGQYAGNVPAQTYRTFVTLKVYACDGQGNWGVTPLGSYNVASSDLDGPEVLLLTWTPSVPTEEEDAVVYAVLSDASGISGVILCYGRGAALVNVTMTFNGTGYTAAIRAYPIGAQVDFCTYSCDNRNNWAVGEWSTYTVCASDITAPTIGSISWSPSAPLSNESIDVRITVSDENGITLVLLAYFDGIVWRNLTMTLISSGPPQYMARLPALGAAGTIQLWVLAWDSKGNLAYTEIMEIEVQQVPPIITTTTTSVITTPDTLVIAATGAIAYGLPIGIMIGLLPSLLRRRKRGG